MAEETVLALLDQWESVYKKGLLTFWLLLLLHERPMYAFEMGQELDAISRGTTTADEKSLYRALRRFEAMGLVELVDAESGEQRLLDTSNPDERRAYLRAWAEHSGSVERFCAGNGIDHIPIVAGQDYVTTLSRFFMARERRL